MKKGAASEVTRKRMAELMNEGFEASELMRTGMRLMIEQALEAEVDEALGGAGVTSVRASLRAATAAVSALVD